MGFFFSRTKGTIDEASQELAWPHLLQAPWHKITSSFARPCFEKSSWGRELFCSYKIWHCCIKRWYFKKYQRELTYKGREDNHFYCGSDIWNLKNDWDKLNRGGNNGLFLTFLFFWGTKAWTWVSCLLDRWPTTWAISPALFVFIIFPKGPLVFS